MEAMLKHVYTGHIELDESAELSNLLSLAMQSAARKYRWLTESSGVYTVQSAPRHMNKLCTASL